MSRRSMGWGARSGHVLLLLLATGAVTACGGDDDSGGGGGAPDAGPGSLADASVSLSVTLDREDLAVAIGEAAAELEVTVVRGGWTGEIVVEASGLPAETSASPITLDGDESVAELQFAVSPAGAPGGPYEVAITASGGGATASTPLMLQVRRRGGRLDDAFSNDGVFYDPFVGGSDTLNGLEVLPGGQIVLGMSRYSPPYELSIARLTPDGEIDRSYGIGGMASIEVTDQPTEWAWAPQPNGRVVVMRTRVEQ